MTEPQSKPKRVERPGKPCLACGTATIRITVDETPYPTVIRCPKCDARDKS